MNKWFAVIIVVIIVLAAGTFFAQSNPQNSPITPSVTLDPTITPVISVDPNEAPKELTVTGEYLCLPHKDTSGPQTLECALGVKLKDNTYVALDMGDLLQSEDSMDIQTGSTIQVTGLYVPIEQINTDMWQKYPLNGIMKVENVTRL